MFNKFYELMFLLLLMTGSLVAISSSSWFTSWLGLELNLLMMIPLIINKYSSLSTESVIKYFLVQAMSSTLFIIFSLMNMMFMKSNYFYNGEMMILITLMMKAGVPPLHFWFPQIIEYMEWTKCFLMMTWQKIAPLTLLSFMFNKTIIYFILMSVLIGTLGGFNQTSMKKMLTYSSIIHSGWMISIIMINFKIWLNYFLIYSTILMSIIYMIKFYKIYNIKMILMMKSLTTFKMTFSMNIFSLAGLPPFLGFLGKFMIIKFFLESSFSTMIMLSLIVSSLVALYFYMKMIYSMLTLSINSMNFIKSSKLDNKMFYLIASTSLNLIMPTIILLT